MTDEIRLVLIGMTGSGKSATANSLTNSNSFKAACSAKSVTSICQKEEGLRDGRNVVVVDTPGVHDTNKESEDIKIEMMKCVGMAAPGPHAFVLVVQIGRMTEEVKTAVQLCLQYFGNHIYQYMIVLFTHSDNLAFDNQTLDDYLKSVPEIFADIIKSCDNRYIAFSNRVDGLEMEQQLDSFFGLVEQIISENGGSCYTTEMIKAVEALVQTRIKEIEAERTRLIEEMFQGLTFRRELHKLKDEIRREVREEIQKENAKMGLVKRIRFLFGKK